MTTSREIVTTRTENLSATTYTSLEAWGNSVSNFEPMTTYDTGKKFYMGVAENDGDWLLKFFYEKTITDSDSVELEEYGSVEITEVVVVP